MKKDMFQEARAELMRRYPGKHIQVGKTVNQFAYWSHVRAQLKKKFPNIDCKKQESRPKISEVREELENASDTWRTIMKEKLSKMYHLSGVIQLL
jgi:hypothetical protein